MSTSNQLIDSLNGNSPEITHAINLIRILPGFLGLRFNPRALIEAVNYLQGIGKDKSLKTLQNYCAIAQQAAEYNNPENVLLIARVLFVRKDGQEVLPRLLLGQPDLEEPEDPTIFPLFPLCIHRDIPFLLIGGYRIGGEGQPPIEYVEWCARDCEIRSAPLIPADDPLASVDEFLESEIWKRLNPDDWQYRMLRLQALRSTSNMYPISEQDENDLLSANTTDESWLRYRRAFKALQGSWDPVANDYKPRVE
jgi:hypothetical protein